MPYVHADGTPCAGPLICAFRDSGGHESLYRDPLAEPELDLDKIEHQISNVSNAQQLLAFKLVHRAVVLRNQPGALAESGTRNWALWEQHARVLLRTMDIEPAGEMPPIPEELPDGSSTEG